MSRALPGWVLFADARVQLKRQGLFHLAHERLERTQKRRLQPKPGKRRRRYWYMRQTDFDRIEQEVKAAVVEKTLDTDPGACPACGGDGEGANAIIGLRPVQCQACHGTGEAHHSRR